MKDGIEQRLFNFIRNRGKVTYNEIASRAIELGYKVDTATRAMRHLTSREDGREPLIRPIKQDGGAHANIAYEYIGVKEVEARPIDYRDAMKLNTELYGR